MAGVNRVAPIVIGQSTAQTIKGSLRFDSTSNQYLTRTPGSAGNQTTWTLSCWFKAPRPGSDFRVTPLFSGSSPWGGVSIYQDKIRFAAYSGSFIVHLHTTQVLRDPSAWYNLVAVFDSTNGTSGNRARVYLNGVRITSFSTETYPSLNATTTINSTGAHRIGWEEGNNVYSDQYLSNVTFIDGLALSPYYFGFTDPLTNTWRPKKFKAEGTTVNDGTTWTSNITTNGGTSFFGGAAANVFDGDISTFVQGALGEDVTFAPTTPILVKQKLRIWADSGSGFGVGNGPYQISYNGTQIYNGKMWYSPYEIEIASGTSLSSLVIDTSAGGEAMRLFAIEVDGIIMKNATTQNLDFGTNGFYLPLDDQDDYTTDRSGKGNNWTANGFTGTSSNPDVVPDSPSGVVGSTKPTSGITTTSSITKPTNYATLNPLDANSSLTLSNGNLGYDATSGAWRPIRANIGVTGTGKWYWEVLIGPTAAVLGVATQSTSLANDYYPGIDSTSYGYIHTGVKYTNGSSSSYGDSFTSGDTIGVAFDSGAGTITFYKNGVSQGVAFTGISTTLTYFPMLAFNGSGTSQANFGQRPFKFAPPDGYLTLCSANVRPSTVVTRPNEYVGIATWSGDGTGNRTIGGLGFKPDFVWGKQRNGANSHQIYDTVRGAGNDNDLASDLTAAEGSATTSADVYGYLSSFDSNGFSVANGTDGSFPAGYWNHSGRTYVAWCWKAGGNSNTFNIDGVGYASAAAAGLDGGSITPTGASVNTKSGFSIITYTGTGAAATIGHGLGIAPQFIITKSRSLTQDWFCYHRFIDATAPADYDISLNTTGSRRDYPSFGDTLPTSTVFSVGATGATNDNNSTYVAYCWAEIPGFSKFGSYTGNGSTDGPMVVTGFRPKWVLIRKVSGDQWAIYDTERMPINPGSNFAYANSSAAEYTDETVYAVDMISNGFKIRNNVGGILNTSGSEYIYAAWAEAPSFNLYGGQSNAR